MMKDSNFRDDLMYENNDFITNIKKIVGRCTRCGWKEHYQLLEFHHKDKKNKKGEIAQMRSKVRLKKLIEEINKCELLCPNCHRYEHTLKK